MIIEAVATGKTVDEAVDAACAELGMGRDSVEIEVLELPSKSFFGLKHIPAKVRVYIDVEEKAPEVKQEPVPAVIKEEAKKERPQKKSVPSEKPKKEKAPAAPKAEAPATAPKAPAAKDDSEDRGPEIPMTERGTAAFNYVKEVVAKMGIDNVEITAHQFEKAVVIKVDGEGAGSVIGKRGETLDALQYLSGLCANRCEGDYCRVILDAGNYRMKRKQTLQQLARRLANNAVKSGRSITLEPMNPYERRIIHATVSEVKGATSMSLGDEPQRYVVISAEGAPIRERRSGGRNNNDRRGPKKPFRGDRSDRRNSGRREKKEPYKETSIREEAPKEALDQPLYGKIEL